MSYIPEQIATMTEAEVDTILAGVWAKQQAVELKIAGYRRAEAETWMTIEKIRNGVRLPEYRTVLHGIELVEQLNLVCKNIETLKAELVRLQEQAAPYEAEYVRRGRWNRVFLANSHGGHAHNGTECSTCHNGEFRTQFSWLVRYSGKTEAEIVADAGERACTTCYPSAPTEDLKRPTKMFTEDEVEAQKAREERQQAQAQRAADRTAKGITTLNGSPLRDKHSGTIATERTAVIEATDALSDRYKNLRIEQIIEADPDLEPFFLDRERRTANEARERAYAMRLIEAIAHKRGVTAEEVLAELEPKALAKAKRDLGGRDWVMRFRYSASFQVREFDDYKARCKADDREPFKALSSRWAKF